MKNKMRERDIEQHLVSSIAKMGGKAYKFSSPGNRAVPDRACFLPNGMTLLVECKAPGKVLTPLQERVVKLLRNLKQAVAIVDSKEGVDHLCNEIKTIMEKFNDK